MDRAILPRFVIPLFAGLVLVSCAEEKQDIVVVSTKLKKERAVNTAVPDEFSSFAPASSGTNVWVEGTVRNVGAASISDVEITFKCAEGAETRVLVASLKLIPAGKTISYRTKVFLSKYNVKLLEEEPEVSYRK